LDRSLEFERLPRRIEICGPSSFLSPGRSLLKSPSPLGGPRTVTLTSSCPRHSPTFSFLSCPPKSALPSLPPPVLDPGKGLAMWGVVYLEGSVTVDQQSFFPLFFLFQWRDRLSISFPPLHEKVVIKNGGVLSEHFSVTLFSRLQAWKIIDSRVIRFTPFSCQGFFTLSSRVGSFLLSSPPCRIERVPPSPSMGT